MQLSEKTISIITPSFNQGQFIEETIKSVISQEGDFYIDYIIMDGGSTDDSVEIIKKYDRLIKEEGWPIKCRGISYFWASEKDNGQVDAIEKGFSRAVGDIAVWLNSDDVFYDPSIFRKVLDVFFEEPGLMMITGDGPFIDRDGRETGLHHVDKIDFTELIYLDYHILQPATFIKKEIYKNERLDRSYNYCFDAEYFIRLINKGYRYKKLNDNLACFRFYPEIKTLTGQGKRYIESLRIARKYGTSIYSYCISLIFKYCNIVLKDKYPRNRLVKRIARQTRIIAYNLITGKVRW